MTDPTLDKTKLAYSIPEAADATGYSASLIRRLITERYLVLRTPPGTSKPVILASELIDWLNSGDTAA